MMLQISKTTNNNFNNLIAPIQKYYIFYLCCRGDNLTVFDEPGGSRISRLEREPMFHAV